MKADPGTQDRAAVQMSESHVARIGGSGPYQICARCVMDTSDPEITFDEHGSCNHCTRFFVRLTSEVFHGAEGMHKLEAVCEAVKRDGKGKPYDCVIGVSGGVDSTFVAWVLKQHGVRPIAVHLDNGWNSELAVDNIKRALDALGIDLITDVLDWEMFRDLQLSFLKASVPNCEIPTDHAITAVLFRTAAKFGLRYIIGGSNVATEGILPFAWGYYHYDFKHIKAIHRRFGTVPLRSYPSLSLGRLLNYVFVRRIRFIPILNYVEYSRPVAVRTLQDKLGWRPYGAKHYESIYTRFFQGYYLPEKFGFDKRRAHLSCLVCTKDMSRDQALAELEQPPYGEWDPNEDKTFVMKKFGLTATEFERIMTSPPKSYADYPSNAFLLVTLSRWKNKLKKLAMRV